MNTLVNQSEKSVLLDQIRKLNKVELHLHFEGSIVPESLLALAKKNHIPIPFSLSTLEKINASYRQYDTFRDFANILLFGVRCMQTPQDFYAVMKQIGSRLAREKVIYAEITWTPQFYISRACGVDKIFQAMNLARHEIEKELGILIRWIPDLVRSFPEPAPMVLQWILQKIREGGSGIVALGLGGPESGHPAERFKELFQVAQKAGLPANPHAGENDGAESVRATLTFLSPRRIAHGVRAAEDPALLIQLAEKKIHLEVCLSSNVQLHVYPGFGQHSLRQLLDAGCEVSINTDDPALFQTSLDAEYLHALQDCGVLWEELIKSIMDALNASYLEEGGKARLRKKIQLNSEI